MNTPTPSSFLPGADLDQCAALRLLDLYDGEKYELLRGSKTNHNSGVATINGKELARICMIPPAAVKFELPRKSFTLAFNIGVLQEVWGHRLSACHFEVLIDGEVVFRRLLDPRTRHRDRRWQKNVLFFDGNEVEPGASTVSLTLRTESDFSSDHLWAAFGEPVVYFTDFEESTRKFGLDPRNTMLMYDDELGFWHDQLADVGPVLRSRLDGEFTTSAQTTIAELCREVLTRTGKKPRVLDFGAGPVSSLTPLHTQGIADVTAVDILADEYSVLTNSRGFDYPVNMKAASGEQLTKVFQEDSFDLVFVENALDHTDIPPLVWYDLMRLAKPGGYVAQRHVIREATRLSFFQMHQYDLYPDEDGTSLILENKSGKRFSLTGLCSLDTVRSSVEKDAQSPDMDWFFSVYRKPEAITWHAEGLAQLVDWIRDAFLQKRRWSSQLEYEFVRLIPREHIFKPHPERRRSGLQIAETFVAPGGSDVD